MSTPDSARLSTLSVATVSGFGATVAMWMSGYVARLPAVQAPGTVLFFLLLLCLLGGGIHAGWISKRIAPAGWAGLLSSLLNLLVLGSALVTGEETNELIPSAAIWIPGFLVTGTLLGLIGGFLGRALRREPRAGFVPRSAFARITAAATLLLLVAGGVVTTTGSGMDVPDWPTSFEANMFLYPLSRMEGGIYYEHAHRLFGTLVGLCTLVLAGWLLVADRRRWMKVVGVAAFLLVAVQGVFGGLRVTENSLSLAVIHGVLGQAIFALLVAMAACTSASFTRGQEPLVTERAGTEYGLAVALIVLLLIQITVGALLRHYSALLHPHLTGAALVLVLAGIVGFRSWGLYAEQGPLSKTGAWLLVIALVQLVLGFAALFVVGTNPAHRERAAVEITLVTAHQAIGAILLAAATLDLVWSRRLLRRP